jgi:uncharacterized membrane protein YgcG
MDSGREAFVQHAAASSASVSGTAGLAAGLAAAYHGSYHGPSSNKHAGEDSNSQLLSAVTCTEDRILIIDVLNAIRMCRHPHSHLCTSWSVVPSGNHNYMLTAYLPEPKHTSSSNLVEVTHDDLSLIQSVNLLRVRVGVAHLNADTWALRIHITGHRAPVSFSVHDTLRFTQKRSLLWPSILPGIGNNNTGSATGCQGGGGSGGGGGFGGASGGSGGGFGRGGDIHNLGRGAVAKNFVQSVVGSIFSGKSENSFSISRDNTNPQHHPANNLETGYRAAAAAEAGRVHLPTAAAAAGSSSGKSGDVFEGNCNEASVSSDSSSSVCVSSLNGRKKRERDY